MCENDPKGIDQPVSSSSRSVSPAMREIVRNCGWRFYAAKSFNSAGYLRNGLPYSGSMALKLFLSVEPFDQPDRRALPQFLREQVCAVYPRLAWKFGRERYEPQEVAYNEKNELVPFDCRTQLNVTQVSQTPDSFWDFVREQCRLDETSPQVFGEAGQVRYLLASDGAMHLRLSGNHSLIDGLMMFKFVDAFVHRLRQAGLKLRPIILEHGQPTMTWDTGTTKYSIEDISTDSSPVLARERMSYLSILHHLRKRRFFSRMRQVIASPRNYRVQLAIAPVASSLRFETFKTSNQEIIREAVQGNRLTRIWEKFSRHEKAGDKLYRYMLNNRLFGRQAFTRLSGDVIVSSFMNRHNDYLAIPVAHALQREGLCIHSRWEQDENLMTRIVGVRNQRRWFR